MATTTAASPPTPEQLAQANAIVRCICAEAGQYPEITVEEFVYPDDEDGDELVTAVRGSLREQMTPVGYMELVKAIGRVLREVRLLPPHTKLSVYLAPEWL